ncbi:hypothetical protein EK21DRAFT_105755 [Setomelanomma holmii]|uniref:Uncharacterized protein n=1 Tax=Setomelanomma holmii TaxID=210430 RepID=A0A9P4LSH6_9PLEO|nr:hypothetical protein EK21DRAFT_105755 [Setomelanomma holmii]
MRPSYDKRLSRPSSKPEPEHGQDDFTIHRTCCEDEIAHDTHEPSYVLRASGYQSGRVVRTGSVYMAGQVPFPLQEWTDIIEDAADPGHTKQGYDQLGRILSCGRWRDERIIKTWVQMEAERESEKSTDESWAKQVRDLAKRRHTRPGSTEQDLPYSEIPFDTAGYCFVATGKRIVRDILSNCHGRHVFLTDTGHVGLGPSEAQIGDQVYYCIGAHSPLVFRPVELGHKDGSKKKVRLVGQCYEMSKDPGATPNSYEYLDII